MSNVDEKRKRTRRSALGVLALAILIFVIVIVVNPNLFKPKEADPLEKTDPTLLYTQTVAAVGQEDGLRLYGFPSSGSFSIPLPNDSSPTYGKLHLEGTIKLPEEDNPVYMTIQVNGKVLYTDRIDGKQEDLSLDLSLPAYMMKEASIRVQVLVNGDALNNICDYNEGEGTLVHITEASYLQAELASKIHTVRDYIRTLPKKINAAFVNASSKEWYETAQGLGIGFTHAGTQVTFEDSPTPKTSILMGSLEELAKIGWEPLLTTDATDVFQLGTLNDEPILAVTKPNPELGKYIFSSLLVTGGSEAIDISKITVPRTEGSVVKLSTLGFSSPVVDFLETNNWYFSYAISDLPGGRYPNKFVADVTLSHGPEKGDIFVLSLELNGEFLGSRVIPDGTTSEVAWKLPERLQKTRSTLKMTLQRRVGSGGCDRTITPVAFQFNDNTRLVVDETYPVSEELRTTPILFSEGATILVTPSTIANSAASLNASVAPISEVLPISEVAPVELIQTTMPSLKKPYILVTSDAKVGQRSRQLPNGDWIAPTKIADNASIETAGALAAINSIIRQEKNGVKLVGMSVSYSGDMNYLHTPIFDREAGVLYTTNGSTVTVDSDANLIPVVPRSGAW